MLHKHTHTRYELQSGFYGIAMVKSETNRNAANVITDHVIGFGVVCVFVCVITEKTFIENYRRREEEN